MLALCWVLFAILAVSQGREKVYDGYQILGVSPTTASHGQLLHELEEKYNVDVYGSRKDMSVMVSPKVAPHVKVALARNGISFHVKTPDVQAVVDAEYDRLQRKTRDYDPNEYNTFEEINDKLAELAAGCDAQNLHCEFASIGQTYEGRPINTFLLSSSDSPKPAVYLLSGLHAREWIPIATNMRILEHMYTSYTTNTEVAYLLDNYNIVFNPVSNPDGYIHTWDSYRYWRKNRQPNPNSSCLGTDLNRNWDYNWGLQGISTNPCSDVFCGSHPHSSQEVAATADHILSLQGVDPGVVAFVDLHNMGRMWMHPWGNTIDFTSFTPCERADDHDDMFAVARAAAVAIQGASGESWEYGTSCEVIYATTGASDDWSKGGAGVKYTFNPELRGSDFVVPPSQIQESFEQVFAGINAMVLEIESIENKK